MKRVTVDANTLSKLAGLTSSMEFYDDAGKTLGYFIPAADRKRGLYGWAETAFSEKEIEAARHEPGGITTEELVRRLKAR